MLETLPFPIVALQVVPDHCGVISQDGSQLRRYKARYDGNFPFHIEQPSFEYGSAQLTQVPGRAIPSL